jgi:hypothetical protein
MKLFYLSRHIFGKSSLICVNNFPLADSFLEGIILESSCICVNMVTAIQHLVIFQKNEDLIYIAAEA